jgi:hypothetical protein
MSIGIDSMVLIYAGLVPVNPQSRSQDYEELRIRATLLIHRCAHDKTTIFLPTVAISELLVPVPRVQKGALIAALQKRFVCAPFDLPAAAIAADLWVEHKKLPQDMQYRDRHVLRADTCIVASVFAAGAREFYTHDEKCRALAGLIMTARDLPTRDPNDMFLADDIRRGEV